MKLIKKTVICVCLLTSVSVHAQQGNDSTTKPAPPVVGKNEDAMLRSENKKKEYKSKEWHQGNVTVADSINREMEKPQSGMPKKMKRPQKPAPPPPPTVLPPAPPPPKE